MTGQGFEFSMPIVLHESLQDAWNRAFEDKDALPRPRLDGVLSDEDIAALRDRNERRRQCAIEALGDRWLGLPVPRKIPLLEPPQWLKTP